MYVEQAILYAYLITILSEIVIILLVERPKNILKWAIGIFLINSLTHPLAIYFLHVQNTSYLLVEVGVFIVEAVWYILAFQINWQRSFLLSGIANIFSILIGIGIRFFLDLI